MPTFIAIGYGDADGYERTAPDVRGRAHAHDEKLREHGARMGIAGRPVQVRNPEGAGAHYQPGTFMSSDLPVAGFTIIEAKDLDHAAALAADTPCAVAHGVVEVWPLGD
ncbi:YciI family protein [Nesterenkonia xinjiangensis]|uniref:YCII-related domain-containing protein n=1 Tax=Nesterenkonia xinjiangensis TaxID=225327 RepID=A0A7Z0GIX9_9MICC|nr:YciI family protein [Nesterenkonia xinjiangensis]NYJ76847.1 hypothetical protein [Nesterenkonia xinjiangensis]